MESMFSRRLLLSLATLGIGVSAVFDNPTQGRRLKYAEHGQVAKCPGGFVDRTNGQAHFWQCGQSCERGAPWVDDCCMCACLEKGAPDTYPVCDKVAVAKQTTEATAPGGPQTAPDDHWLTARGLPTSAPEGSAQAGGQGGNKAYFSVEIVAIAAGALAVIVIAMCSYCYFFRKIAQLEMAGEPRGVKKAPKHVHCPGWTEEGNTCHTDEHSEHHKNKEVIDVHLSTIDQAIARRSNSHQGDRTSLHVSAPQLPKWLALVEPAQPEHEEVLAHMHAASPIGAPAALPRGGSLRQTAHTDGADGHGYDHNGRGMTPSRSTHSLTHDHRHHHDHHHHHHPHIPEMGA